MIPLLLLCLCIIDPITATSTAKELLVAEQKSDSLNALDDTAMEEFSHLISIIGSKGSRSEKRLIRLSLTRLTFNTLYTNGSPELKESLNTFTQNLTHALATIAWSTHTKEVRVNALLRMAFADLKELAKNQPQKELILSLQKNLHIGLAPALTGLRETLRKKIPFKALFALAIIAAGGFAAYKMSLGKKILHRVIDTTRNKLSKEFAALEHVGELARTNEAEIAAYQEVKIQHPDLQEILNPRTGRLELVTEEGTYVRPESSLSKGINAFYTATSVIPHVTERLAAETAKDTAWFNQYHILTHPDGSPQMVRVHYGDYDEMRYLSSEAAENQNPDLAQQASLKLYRDNNGTWHKTYVREPIVKTILGRVDRGLTIAGQALSILDREEIRKLFENVNFKMEQAKNDFITWARHEGLWNNDSNMLIPGLQSEWNAREQKLTYIALDGSRHEAPQSVVTFMFQTIRDLTTEGSAPVEMIKVITEQIKNSLENTRLFLSEIELWDTAANKIKASLSSTNTAGAIETFPIAYGQDNGKPYYEVALAAFSAETQAKLRTKARETQEAKTMARQAGEALNDALKTEIIVQAVLSKGPRTTAGTTPGRGAGAGAGSGTSATPEQSTHKPIMYNVYIENDMVKIYVPISAVERLFLTLDKIDITNPIEFVAAVLQNAKYFRRDSIDEILSVLHGSLANRLINTAEQAKRVDDWKRRGL
jgi:hypothetical protein